MRLIMLFIYLLLVLMGISFAALNASSTQINLYLKTFTLPISVLMIIMFALGLIVSFLMFVSKYWRLKREYARVKNQLKLTEKEIKNLRDIPLKNQH